MAHMDINPKERRQPAHSRGDLLPGIHQNSLEGAKTYSGVKKVRTVIVNGRSVKVKPSQRPTKSKTRKNWLNLPNVPLKEAIQADDAAQITEILTQHPDLVNAASTMVNHMTPLSLAAQHGKPNATKALIAKGANVNKAIAGVSQPTPLISAAKVNAHETLLVLIRDGLALVDKIDKYGCTALHYAAKLGHVEATEVLLSHGANVNSKDFHLRTPLIHACMVLEKKGNLDVIAVLLKNGASVNELDGDDFSEPKKPIFGGKTALHYAALNKSIEAITTLVEAGADIEIRDHNTKEADDCHSEGDLVFDRHPHLPCRAVDYCREMTETKKYLRIKHAEVKERRAHAQDKRGDT